MRLADGKELLELPTSDRAATDAGHRHLWAAMYLSGYAVECLLKAYIIQEIHAHTLEEAIEALDERRSKLGRKPYTSIMRTAAGHNISFLVQLSEINVSTQTDPWATVLLWSSSWRYNTTKVPRANAEEFVMNISRIVEWLLVKLGG